MVIDIPGGLFGQSDVRETATADPSGTSYWSIAGALFHAEQPDVQDVLRVQTRGYIDVSAGNVPLFAQVNLPHGATVTAAVVYGNVGATDETWTLYREELNASDVGEALGTAFVGTEDTSISNGIVDNSTYKYWFVCVSMETNDRIFGARITYTT